MQLQNMLGRKASLSKTISEADVDAFADLTGDTNPLHLNENYATRTQFGRRIAHGMFGVSLISAVLGTVLPGFGTIYLGQEVRFEGPIYPGDTITAEVEVIQVREDKPILTLATTVRRQDGSVVITGQAVVKFKPSAV